MSEIKYILFDAANTLIHKPQLWGAINGVFVKNNYQVELSDLKRNHKIISETTIFPDRTNKLFYEKFNSNLLYSLGIMPEPKLLDELFSACSYLPWEKFVDTQVLDNIKLPFGVLSNFNSRLNNELDALFGKSFFDQIIISEVEGIRKPSVDFYELAKHRLPYKANEVLYIGDSVRLDYEPAIKVGFRSKIIDRDLFYSNKQICISSLKELL